MMVKFNSAPYLTLVGSFNRLISGTPAGPGGVPAAVPPAHPFRLISFITCSGEITFWHALTGRKSKLAGVSAIEYIAQNLRMHGPAWLGDLFCRAILPPGGGVTVPPDCTAEWKMLCAGDLCFDYETIEARIRAYALGPDATYDVVPAEQRLMSKPRLVSLARWVPVVLAEMGFPSTVGLAGTPSDVYSLANFYADEAKGLVQSTVFKTIKISIEGITLETSARLASD